ncbi:conjugative transposon protein TraM [Spirosoma sp.]|uniref:conjugative transposon protein TraM n=1 Tax=Spirosoma sp. TaxID=1899569 RepID=UPI00261DBD5B|nr:conjugative transposon protein TraM [Spirosoma sp.]MCX6213759.1 conjugative transposon protein TraM [Spirosoma sp.]
METQKRSLKDLFGDKRFLWSIPVFLVLVGAFLWVVSSSPEKEAPQQTPSVINTRVPSAKTDTSLSKANKLDLQTEAAVGASTPGENPQASNMQGIPDAQEYVYGSRYKTPSSRSMSHLDSTVYETNRPSRRSQSSAGAFPEVVNHRSSGSRGSSSFPLAESDSRLDDDDAPITSPQQAKEQADKKAKLQMALDKQAKLERLLTEYKQDKATREAREQDKTKALKVVTDEEGRMAVPITSLTGRDYTGRNSFFGLYTEDARKAQQRLLDAEVGTIRAMVYGDQEISSMGSRIKIRLLEPLYIRGIVIPANTLLYGMGQFAGQRINLLIRSIQYQNRLFPTNIQVYDMDGMAGLYVPNMTNLDLAKQTAAQVAQSSGGGGLGGGLYVNSSPSAVLTSAGLQAGQQITQGVKQGLARKAQMQRAYLKNNYFVLLRTVDRTEQGGTGSVGTPGNPPIMPVSSPITEKQMQLQMLQNIIKEQ